MSSKQSKKTKDLDRRQTAWFQLVSCAGAFIDRYKGEVSTAVIKDVVNLQACVEKVLEVEGVQPISDKSFE